MMESVLELISTDHKSCSYNGCVGKVNENSEFCHFHDKVKKRCDFRDCQILSTSPYIGSCWFHEKFLSGMYILDDMIIRVKNCLNTDNVCGEYDKNSMKFCFNPVVPSTSSCHLHLEREVQDMRDIIARACVHFHMISCKECTIDEVPEHCQLTMHFRDCAKCCEGHGDIECFTEGWRNNLFKCESNDCNNYLDMNVRCLSPYCSKCYFALYKGEIHEVKDFETYIKNAIESHAKSTKVEYVYHVPLT